MFTISAIENMIQPALKKIIFFTCISQDRFSVLFLKYTLVAALVAPMGLFADRRLRQQNLQTAEKHEFNLNSSLLCTTYRYLYFLIFVFITFAIALYFPRPKCAVQCHIKVLREMHQILPPLSFKFGGCVKISNALTLEN